MGLFKTLQAVVVINSTQLILTAFIKIAATLFHLKKIHNTGEKREKWRR